MLLVIDEFEPSRDLTITDILRVVGERRRATSYTAPDGSWLLMVCWKWMISRRFSFGCFPIDE
jgi:hypothetical protein